MFYQKCIWFYKHDIIYALVNVYEWYVYNVYILYIYVTQYMYIYIIYLLYTIYIYICIYIRVLQLSLHYFSITLFKVLGSLPIIDMEAYPPPLSLQQWPHFFFVTAKNVRRQFLSKFSDFFFWKTWNTKIYLEAYFFQ